MQRLPIHAILPELRERLAACPAVILSAPPGSGKTTAVPLSLLDEPWLAGKKILLLEPRRLAARLAAAFMGKLLGEEVGQRVGYRVRFESRVSRDTRVEVCTDGVFLRRLQADPELAGVGLVIFDEFHERGLNADLSLALCLDAQAGLRDDLKLLIMSATLDTEAISRLLGKAPVVVGPGQSHPVSIRYHDGPPRAPAASAREIAGQMAAAIRRTLRDEPGDILAFFPGAAEIRQAHALLAAELPGEIRIHPLYGDLSLAEQAAAVQPGPEGLRRIILATPIAETSLTIEGIHSVVDSGWQRSPRFDPNSGLSRLTTRRISLASAIQRAGRAGRMAPGHCLRLWSRAEEHGFLAFEPPEITVADLSGLALELARWGVRDPGQLPWLDPPPAGPLAQAREILSLLGALDKENRLTTMGRRMAELPLHPRLARMLVAATAHDQATMDTACSLAALLGERDILKGREKSADIEERLHALEIFRRHGAGAARALDADPDACRRVAQTAKQLKELLPRARKPGQEEVRSLGALLALAFPDRVAQGRGAASGGRYRLTSGRGAALLPHDPLARHEYLAVTELDAGKSEGRIFLAAPLEREEIMALFADRLCRKEEVVWEEESGRVSAGRDLRLGELVLARENLAKPSPEAVLAAVLSAARASGMGLLPWNDKARSLQARVESLRFWQPEAKWPDFSDEWLGERLDQWLAPWLAGIRSLEQLNKLDLAAILTARLSWPQQQSLDRLAPTHLTVPSGSRIRIAYEPGKPPVLAVRLQELFGLAETPKICDNTVPVLLHLLSPARRPMQITQDLRGFWEGAYHEVKKELRGRYPKHPWPDDPWQAQPTSRAKPRK